LGLNEAHAVVHEVAFQLGTQDKPEYGVLTASIPAAEVTKLRDAATAANLKPVSLMLSGVVAVNMVQSRPSLLPEDGAVGFLEIGAANSVLLVFAGRDLALARHLRIGLSMMLEALRAATQLDMETAIKLFHSGSFDFSANIAATVKPWLHQIGISLDFFERRYGRSVGVLNLFGGGARSQVIEGMIAERTRCPVNRWSALEGLEGLTPPASAGDDAAPFALAAAEALRTMRIGDSHAV
jgi:Tfp pilus assembly PilM family ATPase